jgi:hypothetical protein
MTEEIEHKHGYKGSNGLIWKEGWYIDKDGYKNIRNPNHPFCHCNGYVLEHRLVMEEYLGRHLKPEEDVHHLDLNKENNRIGNLMLFPNRAEHMRYEMGGNQRAKIEMFGRVCLLCGSTKTHIKKSGRLHWMSYRDGFICKKCHNKLPEIRKKHRQYNKKYEEKKREKKNILI